MVKIEKCLARRCFGLLLGALLLGGCSGAGTSGAVTTAALSPVVNALQPAAGAGSESAPASSPFTLPAQVQQGLLPPLLAPAAMPEPARFDVAAEGLAVRAFFAGLVEGTPTNIVVHPDVEGTISLRLKNVTLPQVLAIVQQVYGYPFQAIEGGYQILANNLQTRIFEVDYLTLKRVGISSTRVSSGQVSQDSDTSRAEDGTTTSSSSSNSDSVSGSQIDTSSESDFWPAFQSALTSLVGAQDGRRVIVQPQAGLVVVRALPQELEVVADYLQKMAGTLQRQVILEAKIIEVELSDGFQAGVNWGALIHNGTNIARVGQVGGGTSLDTGSSEISSNSGNLDPWAASAINGLASSAFGGVFSAALEFDDFQAFIEAVKNQGDVQVLSSPRISTLNNQKAVIKVGTDEFFVTDISSDTVTGTTTTTTPDITLTPFFSGIALDVTPQISDGGQVILHIHPTVSDVVDQTKRITVSGQEQSLPLAFSSVRESDTIVRARSGQVVVIGGLMKNSKSTETAAIPLLGDLPGVGRLFRQQRDSMRKSELIILLKPQVVRQDQDWAGDIERTRQRIEGLL